MDNVTHSIVGLIMAEAAIVFREVRTKNEPPSREFAAYAVLVCVLANNAPDMDSAYASLLTRPLGSVLHHRGHTHTLALAPLLGALAVALTLTVARARGTRFGVRDMAWLVSLGVAGVAVHIGLDSTNSYGVHPFWPFYDGWFYGDSVFIFEPLIWSAAIPPLVVSARARWAKVTLSALVLFGVGICWLHDLVPRSMALFVTLVACLTAVASLRSTRLKRVLISAGAATAVALAFAASGGVARGEVARGAARQFPRAVTHDTILTPMPANPLCWQVVLVQTEGDRYVARTGVIAIFSSFMPSRECPSGVVTAPTAPSEPVPVPTEPSLHWIREFSGPLVELRALARESCVFSALLRFARAPFWAKDEALGRIAGDVRYDRTSGLDFSDTVLDGIGCPEHLPPWIPPRHALLDARAP